MKLLPSTVATIVSAIPRGVFVTVREIEAMLPVHHGRSTIRAVLVALARAGGAEVEEIVCPQYGQKRYRLREVSS